MWLITSKHSPYDDEQVPYEEGVLEFVKREVTPYRPDAWIDIDKIKLVVR